MPSVTIGGKHVRGQPAWRRPEPPGVTAEARSGGFAPNGFRSGARVVADVRSAHASGPMSTWSKSPRQTYKSRLGPEAIGGTIRTCIGPAADAPSAVRPPLRDEQPVVQAPRRPGAASRRICSACRSTGGKVLRVQDYQPFMDNLRCDEFTRFRQTNPILPFHSKYLDSGHALDPLCHGTSFRPFFIDGNHSPSLL